MAGPAGRAGTRRAGGARLVVPGHSPRPGGAGPGLTGIPVIGATGSAGRHVVASLVEGGHPVRALVRGVAKTVLPAGVEAVQGNLAEPESLGERGVRGRPAARLGVVRAGTGAGDRHRAGGARASAARHPRPGAGSRGGLPVARRPRAGPSDRRTVGPSGHRAAPWNVSSGRP
ncbi:NmrA family NAD(P)-binding protein [Kitasatospora sp. NPDC058048]|uniref:NmrA family NAD(P)-binding protein n=1 Tax=Kitasatospora sp. NPDC058048 TaxID=3346313 RepID=UPI0036DA8E60